MDDLNKVTKVMMKDCPATHRKASYRSCDYNVT